MVFKFVEESLQKVRDKEWAGKAHQTLLVTGNIIEGLGKSGVPLIGLLGISLKLGANVLDPIPRMSDLKKEREEIEKAIEDAESGYVQKALTTQLQSVEEVINEQMAKHYRSLQSEVQKSFEYLSEDLEKIEVSLSEMQEVIHMTYELVLDQRFKSGIELIESAHKVFMKGCHNIESIMTKLDNFIFQLETIAMDSLSQKKVEQYLQALLKTKGCNEAKIAFNYIAIVKSKQLQLVTVYFIYKNDPTSVTNEFQCFNMEFEQLLKMYKKLFDEKFYPQNCPDITSYGSAEDKSFELDHEGIKHLNEVKPTSQNSSRDELQMLELDMLEGK